MDHSTRVKALFDCTGRYLATDAHVRFRARLVRNMLGDVRESRLADLGCGNGGISLQFAGAGNELTLVDLSANMLALAAGNARALPNDRIKFVQSDLGSFVSDGAFDIVLCIGVLAHVPSVTDALCRLSDLTRPGGRCIVQFTDSDTVVGRMVTRYYSRTSERIDGYRLNIVHRRRLVAAAQECSLEVADSRSYLSFLPGFGRLPGSVLYALQGATLNRTLTPGLGSERLLLLQRRAL